MTKSEMSASQWADQFESGPFLDAIELYMNRFGDEPVRVFQSPARVNLRGMHVDTHGGYLNLMAIPRHTVVVMGARDDMVFHATSSGHRDNDFCTNIGESELSVSGWHKYVAGVIDVVRDLPGEPTPKGCNIAIATDVPTGGGLSSSAALCVALMQALCDAWGATPSNEELAVAVQDAEWKAGARIGLSDQSAMIIAQPNTFTNIAIDPQNPSLDGETIPWSDEVSLVVAHSGTSRSLSGAQRVGYARNRFAYSVAMHLVRDAMGRLGHEESFVEQTRLLSHLTADRFEEHGGEAALLNILTSIPMEGELDTLFSLAGENLRETYDSYFGDLPDSDRPKTFSLRGPLLYGVAESERSRVFGETFASREWQRVGALLNAGHDGDRVTNPDGSAHKRSAEPITPFALSPGDYGASTPVLDFLVDTALEAGAYGATLTGAGMGGAIIALFPTALCEEGVSALNAAVQSDTFKDRLGPDAAFSGAEIFAVRPVGGAGPVIP